MGVCVFTDVFSDRIVNFSVSGCASGWALVAAVALFIASISSICVYLVVGEPNALVATKITGSLTVVFVVFGVIFYVIHRRLLPDWTSCTHVVWRKNKEKPKEECADDSASEIDSLT